MYPQCALLILCGTIEEEEPEDRAKDIFTSKFHSLPLLNVHQPLNLPNLIFFTAATYFSSCHSNLSLQASIPVVVLVEDVVDGAEELLDVVHDRLLGGEGVHRQVGLVVP